MLRMKHQRMPFRVTEGFEGDLVVNVTSVNSTLALRLQDTGFDGNANTFTMVYPVSAPNR